MAGFIRGHQECTTVKNTIEIGCLVTLWEPNNLQWVSIERPAGRNVKSWFLDPDIQACPILVLDIGQVPFDSKCYPKDYILGLTSVGKVLWFDRAMVKPIHGTQEVPLEPRWLFPLVML